MDKIEIKAIGIENLSGESKTFANINNKKVFLENFKIDDMYIERLSTIMLKFNEISQLLTSKLSSLVETFNRIDVNKLLEYSKFILNLNGRICLLYCVYWGIIAVAFLKIVW